MTSLEARGGAASPKGGRSETGAHSDAAAEANAAYGYGECQRGDCDGVAIPGSEFCANHEGDATPVSPPTIAEVYDRLRDEWEALGLLSYHGAPWDRRAGTTFYADLTQDDIENVRTLLRDTAAAIEGLS